MRLWLRRVRLLLTATALAGLALATLGQVLRDRPGVPWWLFYLPLLPAGLGVVLLDLVCAGRCLPRPRFALALLGLAASAWAASLLLALGGGRAEDPQRRPVALLQWNVHWGGGREASPATWQQITEEIEGHSPEVVVLAEAPAPERGWLEGLARKHGWSIAQCRSAPGSSYWYNLAVCAAGPVRREYEAEAPNGHVMSALVPVRGRTLRVLVVDGISEPRQSRLPLLADVAERCRRAQEEGSPIDVLAGDFNTPSRSVGFDPFPTLAGGYRLASWSAVGWRGTFPADWPLYDIDHVWVHSRFAIQGSELFTSPASDHRGQVVRFYLPGEE
jgi:endonuclease/exonuclease/phosphatase family metal-dependent hydrolase